MPSAIRSAMSSALVWRDGALVRADEAGVSVLSHAIQRGSAVFDVLSFQESTKGVALFRLREHVDRFFRSASLVGLDVPFTPEEIGAAAVEVVGATGLREGLVRIVGTFGSVEGDLVPKSRAGSVAIAAYARDLPPSMRPAVARVTIPRDVRKAGPDVLPPQAKVAAAYLGPMLAKARALADGFDDVVLLDRHGAVAEAPTANVFAVLGGRLTTPPLLNVLAGVTRDAVLTLARAEGLAVEEALFGAESLRSAREAFLTATSFGVLPVASIETLSPEDGAPGPITRRLKARFDAILAGQDDAFAHWLTPVAPARPPG